MINWSYYGLKAWTHLFGEGHTKELVFKVIFCIFVVIGAAANLGPVIDFSDAATLCNGGGERLRALLPDESGAAGACLLYRTPEKRRNP